MLDRDAQFAYLNDQATDHLAAGDPVISVDTKKRSWSGPTRTAAGSAALAADTGLTITVCHLPPGTSKWNKIEHRLFSHISMNWRGRPLTSHEVIVETIAATTTSTGLTVHAELDQATYPRCQSPTRNEALETEHILTRHDFHGEWNYTLSPKPRHAESGLD